MIHTEHQTPHTQPDPAEQLRRFDIKALAGIVGAFTLTVTAELAELSMGHFEASNKVLAAGMVGTLATGAAAYVRHNQLERRTRR